MMPDPDGHFCFGTKPPFVYGAQQPLAFWHQAAIEAAAKRADARAR
jgi:hypothetical protein